MPLDPLSALSVAASVVQFLDFGNKIVSKGIQAYKSNDGALIENAEIEEATQRLAQLSKFSKHPWCLIGGEPLLLRQKSDVRICNILQICISIRNK